MMPARSSASLRSCGSLPPARRPVNQRRVHAEALAQTGRDQQYKQPVAQGRIRGQLRQAVLPADVRHQAVDQRLEGGVHLQVLWPAVVARRGQDLDGDAGDFRVALFHDVRGQQFSGGRSGRLPDLQTAQPFDRLGRDFQQPALAGAAGLQRQRQGQVQHRVIDEAPADVRLDVGHQPHPASTSSDSTSWRARCSSLSWSPGVCRVRPSRKESRKTGSPSSGEPHSRPAAPGGGRTRSRPGKRQN